VSDGSATYVHAKGGLLATRSGADTSYPVADALGSIRAITDGAGNVTGSAAYDPFGATTTQAGASSALGFTGELSDATGLINLRARLYDPATGAFTQTDPLRPGAPGVVGYNPYAYVGSNPVTWTDPSGLELAAGAIQYRYVSLAAAASLVTTGVRISAAILRLALILALPVGTALCLIACGLTDLR
jgi:RHS repeat-associated protein